MINEIITQLTNNCVTLQQVVRSDEINEQGVNTAAEIKSVLNPSFGDNLCPIMLDENTTYPASAYQLVKSTRLGDDNYEFVHEDKYVLQIYEQTYPKLDQIVKSASTALLKYTKPNQAGSIEITDMLQDWEYEHRLYRCALELTITHLANAKQSVPAAFIHSLRAAAGDDLYDRGTAQRVTEYFVVTLICASKDLETTRQATADCLVGFQISPQSHPVEYSDGSSIGVHGHITVWREVYKYDRYIRS